MGVLHKKYTTENY